MRKLLILTVLSILPALGCADGLETMRRIEVWKLQTYLTPAQPVVAASPCGNPCGAPAAAAPACNCPGGATAAIGSAATTAASIPAGAVPNAVTAGYPADADVPVPGSITVGPERPAETVSTEELDGVLKQP
jgi:hypothetical protein